MNIKLSMVLQRAIFKTITSLPYSFSSINTFRLTDNGLQLHYLSKLVIVNARSAHNPAGLCCTGYREHVCDSPDVLWKQSSWEFLSLLRCTFLLFPVLQYYKSRHDRRQRQPMHCKCSNASRRWQRCDRVRTR